ncbi:MAG: family peptidase [Myxococcales bacterium]|nr:family peptidase [Myxococcales bacterium]
MLVCVACSAHEAKPLALSPAEQPTIEGPGLRLPEGVTPLAYALRLELDPDSETFHGEVKIRTRLDKPTDRVWLHADQLVLTNPRFDEGPLAALPATNDPMRGFSFGHVIAPGIITLSFELAGHTTKDEEGLFRQRADNLWYLFSQGESLFARRITPCFDEPRFKTPWQVTLVVPAGQVALGNMPVVRETKRADGRSEIEFAPTPPMPSYLLAMAVGPFEIVDAGTVGRNRVPLRVAVEHGDRGRAGIAAAKLPAIVASLEAYLDDPLPWPKLDLVAVPHLFGAMENPGLITFDAPMIVGDPDRHNFVQRFVHVAAHELAHQWFGNLVTPAWWNDLWLSEAFASWLSDKVAVELGAFEDAPLRAALQREQALEADAEPGAKPLRRAIGREDDPDNAFDAIAYDKGAAVLSTFERWIGEPKLRGALRVYIRSHRENVAITSDLFGAIASAAGVAIADSFKSYVDHSGAPIVELSLACERSPRVIAHARDVTVPVCIRYPGPHGALRTCALVADRTELPLLTCPAWVAGNDGAGYYHVVSTIPPPPIADLAPAERIAFGDDIAAAIERGELPVKHAVAQLTLLARAPDPYAQHAAAAIAIAVDPLVDDETRPRWTAWLATRFAGRLGVKAVLSPPTFADRQVRDDLVSLIAERMPPATAKRALEVTRDALAHHGEPDPDLVAIAAREGGAELFDQLATVARTSTDLDAREAAFDSLGMFGPELAPRAVEVFLTSDAPAPLAWTAVAGYLQRPATRAAGWQAVRAQLPALLARISGVSAGMIVEAAASICDTQLRAEIVAALELRLASIADGRRQLDRSLASVDRCIARRSRAGDLARALP